MISEAGCVVAREWLKCLLIMRMDGKHVSEWVINVEIAVKIQPKSGG